MATAKKLPSGSWRIRVYDYTDSANKKHYKSFTCNDTSAKGKRICEAMAAEWAIEIEKKEKSGLTLSEAWDKYIELKNNVLSPSTVSNYKNTKKHCFKSLMDMDINDITQEMIQSEINSLAVKNAPKTVKNKHGILSAVLKEYRPEFVLTTKLPQAIKPTLYIPSEEEVKSIMAYAKENDHDMYIAILLGAFGPMRRSEICALEDKDILHNNTIHVQRAMVLDENREWVIKTTKTVSSNRYINLPDFVYDELKGSKGRVIELHPNNITDRFETILRNANVPHFRFHDLRHFGASMLHAMGVPEAYIMARGGWGDSATLKNIYRHTLTEKVNAENERINNYIEKFKIQ